MPDRTQPSRLQVFLCHSSGDKVVVRTLYQRLESEPWLDPWLDEEKLLPGQNWRDEIERAVEQSHIILVCLSPSSITKEGYVQREIRVALDRADYMPEGTAYIVPVKLEECAIPHRLRQWQWVNYYQESSYERLLQALRLRAGQLSIETETSRPPTQTPAPSRTTPPVDTAANPAPTRAAPRSALIRLLRDRLSPSDVRDIADEYGERENAPGSLYDQIVGKVGVNEAVRELVQYAANRNDAAGVVAVIGAWRPDLHGALNDLGYSLGEIPQSSGSVAGAGQPFVAVQQPSPPAPQHVPVPQPAETEQDRLLQEIADERTSHERRRDIGDKLDEIGDRRTGVGLRADGLPDILWCAVSPPPMGTVMLGTNDQEDNRRRNHTFSAPFLIAAYPVTHAQFAAFVEAKDGFSNRAWWQGFPLRYEGQAYRNPKNGKGNSPRDTVSWYQAVAFCRWLTQRLTGERLRNAGGDLSLVVGQGTEIRLPTEWEWEYAARGTDERAYPWGRWREGYANTEGAGLNRTVAVGLYPQGEGWSGAQDMSGNVWEWCLNNYSKDGENRAMRGGSFHFDHEYAACTYRLGARPAFDVDFYGFRVVVAAPLAPSDL